MNPAQVVLEVEDDGKGFVHSGQGDPAPTSSVTRKDGGLGLVDLASLAKSFDGSFSVVSQPGSGTTVVLRIPDRPRNEGSNLSNDQSHGS